MAMLLVAGLVAGTAATKKNVLFLICDDLRPQLKEVMNPRSALSISSTGHLSIPLAGGARCARWLFCAYRGSVLACRALRVRGTVTLGIILVDHQHLRCESAQAHSKLTDSVANVCSVLIAGIRPDIYAHPIL